MSTDDPVLMPISIHAPHEGERQRQYQLSQRWQRFQSTLPTRGSDMVAHRRLERDLISIHAPHEGERLDDLTDATPAQMISIHAPHEGERRRGEGIYRAFGGFQSTLPTRGSDYLRPRAKTSNTYFNPRSPRGGATRRTRVFYAVSIISIHAPHEGERQEIEFTRTDDTKFQSTLPTRGSDMKRGGLHLRHMHFNPRSPRGGATLQRLWSGRLKINFNPRSPRGGATMPAFHNFLDAVISIHAPHEGERRFIDGHWIHTIFDFNPRSPRGGATSSATVKQSRGIFQSTLPTRGSDELMLRLSLNIREFQSTLPTRGSDLIQLVWDYHSDISIHAPHEGERRYNCIYA